MKDRVVLNYYDGPRLTVTEEDDGKIFVHWALTYMHNERDEVWLHLEITVPEAHELMDLGEGFLEPWFAKILGRGFQITENHADEMGPWDQWDKVSLDSDHLS